MKVYLDYAATTPLDPQVLEAMLPYLQNEFANPSSLHTYGQNARRGVETAREEVASALRTISRQIIFTSSATEATNHAIRSFMAKHKNGHIITSKIEHKATLNTCKYLERQGYEVSYLVPDEKGAITPEAVKAALQDNTALIALMLVNNETGALTDISTISKIAHQAGALLFCDAVQAFAHTPVDVQALEADMLTISGHKVYGPKGVGVLYTREGLALKPFLLGGEQERGLRAGTLNVPAIVGMGKAAQLAMEREEEDNKNISAFRDYLQGKLLAIEGVSVNAGLIPRGAKHLNVRIAGVDGEAVLMGLDQEGVMVSGGSACASGSLEPSHVLIAMGLSRTEAKASLRFSLGRGLTYEMLDYAAENFAEVVERCRKAA